MKKITYLLAALFLSSLGLNAQEFITVWKTDNPGTSSDTQITIPTTGDGYDYNVDWGDGTTSSNVMGDVTHTYAVVGTYTISVSGDFPQIYFNNSGDRQKLLSVNQWGTNSWRSMEKAFFGCQNMEVLATDAPDLSGVTSLASMFKKTKGTFDHIGNWDTATITTMYAMFLNSKNFNTDISAWDVSQVKSMAVMFKGASAFNQPLAGWDTGKVRSLNSTFENATSFNQDLSSWDLINLRTAKKTFLNANNFNQDISSWNVSLVRSMNNILVGANMNSYNYDRLLEGWSQLDLVDNVIFNTDATYCSGADAKAFIESNYGWTITDSGLNTLPVTFVVVPVDQTQLTDPVTEMYSLPDYVSLGEAYALESCLSASTSVVPVQTPAPGTNLPIGEHVISFTAEFPGGEIVEECFLLKVENDFSVPSNRDFVTVWNTFLGGTNFVKIPTIGEGYMYDIDWGDGTIEYGVTGAVNHEYDSGGTYQVRIGGSFPRIYFRDEAESLRKKIIDVRQWGVVAWQSMESAFYNCPNLNVTATDVPNLSLATNISHMFYNADSLNESFANWDVSTITDMSYVFDSCNVFNGQLTNWDTSNVLTMEGMFEFAVAFNRPIDNWDVSSVTNMESMFAFARGFNKSLESWDVSSVTNMTDMLRDAEIYNQPMNDWDVSQVTSMNGMFEDAEKFNQPIGDWDVSNVTDMSAMFSDAERFNQPIGDWDVSNVTNMSNMFRRAEKFNQPIGDWDVSSVTDMSFMFYSSTFDDSEFNQPIGSWNVSNVTNMRRMFEEARNFNQPINSWDVSNVTNMDSMFSGTSAFNQPLDDWDVSNVTDMESMFEDTVAFNQNIEVWDVSSVTRMTDMFYGSESFNQPLEDWDVSNVTSMRGMFAWSEAFNQPLNGWDVSSVTDMYQMFRQWFSLPMAFDQPLDEWDVSNVSNMTQMFYYSNIRTEYYDDMLRAWSSLDLRTGVTFGAGETYYCSSGEQRNSIISEFGWTFKDLGLDPACALPVAGVLLVPVEKVGISNERISVYPNPVIDQLNITISGDLILQHIIIYDMLGRVVRSERMGSYSGQLSQSLSVQELESGSYVVSLKLEDGTIENKTILKQ